MYYLHYHHYLHYLDMFWADVRRKAVKVSWPSWRRPLRGRGYKPRASQPQVHEDDEAQDSGPTDGIVEEAAPETILPMDDECES